MCDACYALDEAMGLARAIELNILHSETLPIRQPTPATLFGSGTVERLKGIVASLEIALVIVDTSLSPIQQRNLEKAWKVKVIDRTGLILEIFGARACTSEGRLQVELAALTYQRSRLVRSWTHLERQRGGLGFIGGPGETQIEVDRRLIDERITQIKNKIGKVKRTRELHRKARREVPYPIVALVGYTNAGKSTLFNRLTGAKVIAKDLLFATLDPTMRLLKLPSGRKIILSGTVGFISNLPHELIAAFRATLEEVCEADLLLHIRDISHPQTLQQQDDVLKILDVLDLSEKVEKSTFHVLNKMDLLSENEKESLPQTRSLYRASASTGEGLPELLAAIDEKITSSEHLYTYDIPFQEGASLAWLHENGDMIKSSATETHTHLEVRLCPKDAERFKKKFLKKT
ncbi:MAG: GTPase HflX [Gammaproteobacteria bacterium]|nr:GTPase HflX [Gammaproteobacteria bacterium]